METLSTQIKKDVLKLERDLKNIANSDRMNAYVFFKKTGLHYQWFYSWRSGKLPYVVSADKILKIAMDLGL